MPCERPPFKQNIEDGKLKLANGDSVPVVSGLCTIENMEGARNLRIEHGFFVDQQVKVLRDTGSELAAVRRNLV